MECKYSFMPNLIGSLVKTQLIFGHGWIIESIWKLCYVITYPYWLFLGATMATATSRRVTTPPAHAPRQIMSGKQRLHKFLNIKYLCEHIDGLTHWPLEDLNEIFYVDNFQANFSDCWLRYLLWRLAVITIMAWCHANAVRSLIWCH